MGTGTSKLNFVIDAQDNASGQISGIGDSFSQVGAAAGAAGAGVAMAITIVMELATKIKEVATVAIQKLWDFAKTSQKVAASAEILAGSVDVLAKNYGFSAEAIANIRTTLTESGKSLEDINRVIQTLIETQMEEKTAIDLVNASRDYGIRGEMTSTEALEKMLRAINLVQVAELDELGIMINKQDITDRLGSSLDGLSIQEQKVAYQTELTKMIMEQSVGVAGLYDEAMGTVGKKLGSIEGLMGNVHEAVGNLINEALYPVVDQMYKWLKAFNEWRESAEGGKPILEKLQAIIGHLADVTFQNLITVVNFVWNTWNNLVNQWNDSQGIIGWLKGEVEEITWLLQDLWNKIYENKEMWLSLATGLGGVVLGAFWAISNGIKLVISIINHSIDAINWLGKAYLYLSPKIHGVGKILSALGSYMGGVIQMAYNLANSFVQMAKDIINAVTAVKSTVTKLFTAIGQALDGDFKGAMVSAMSIFPNFVSSAKKGVSDIYYAVSEGSGLVAEGISLLGQDWSDMWKDMEKVDIQNFDFNSLFKKTEEDAKDAGDGMADFADATGDAGGSSKKAKKEVDELAKALEKMHEQLKKDIEGFKDASVVLKDKINKAWDDFIARLDKIKHGKIAQRITKIKDRLKDLRKELSTNLNKDNLLSRLKADLTELQDEYDETVKAGRKNTAEDIAKEWVDTEQRKADLVEKINEEAAKSETERDNEKLEALEAELQKEIDYLDSHYKEYVKYQDYIEEERKKASMDAIELLLYEQAQEEKKLRDELEAKKAALKAEYEIEKEAMEAEMALLEEKLEKQVKKYNKKLKKARRTFKKQMSLIKKDVRGIIDDIFAMWGKMPDQLEGVFESLIEKIINKNQKSGDVVSKKKKNSEGNKVNININIGRGAKKSDATAIASAVQRVLNQNLINQSIGA